MFKSAGLNIFHLPVDKDGMNPDDLIDLHTKASHSYGVFESRLSKSNGYCAFISET